ncbi:MAG: hypothetical protein LHV68_10560 [Elusimicrobia bacterium]|nr:hypothetical protein [Candidatus Liberimonas magnetica]
MRKLIAFLMIFIFIASACEKKRDRLSDNTFSIAIDPATAVNIYSGNSVNLKAVCRSAQSNDVNGNPVWSVDKNLGTFTPSSGRSTVFKAGSSPGNGKIYASYSSVVANVALNVTASSGSTAGSYIIYSDQFSTDLSAPGTFDDGVSLIILSVTSLSSEGLQAFKAVFSVVAGGYTGWFVSENTSKDMSAYSSGYLRFDIMTDYDIEIGIRSNNTNSGTNSAKKFISSYATPNGSSFQPVAIPISDLKAAEPTLDLSQMKDMFIASALGSHIGAQTNRVFIIDHIRWTTQ